MSRTRHQDRYARRGYDDCGHPVATDWAWRIAELEAEVEALREQHSPTEIDAKRLGATMTKGRAWMEANGWTRPHPDYPEAYVSPKDERPSAYSVLDFSDAEASFTVGPAHLARAIAGNAGRTWAPMPSDVWSVLIEIAGMP